MLHIHEVDTTRRRDVNRFINLPFELYKDSPYWVPTSRATTRMQLNREKNPFYRANDAVFFLAQQNGQDVGRIAVLHPARFNDLHDLQDSHFYLFDSIDDQGVANALFDAAVEWASKRGLSRFRGPLGFMALDGYGMLAKGFDHYPAVGIPYNYDYYPHLAEGWGFELEEQVLSGYAKIPDLLEQFPEKIERVAEKVKERYGYTVKQFKNKREMIDWARPRIVELYNRIFMNQLGTPPLILEEFDLIIDDVFTITRPDMIKVIVREEDEQLVGFLFAFIDISRGLRKSRGRLLPFGLFYILHDLYTTDWLNLNGMGVMPEYQGLGGTSVLYAELRKTLMQFPRFVHADVVQISEFNAASLNEMKKFGMGWYKIHHIYHREI